MKKALTILAGCPNGATLDALALNGIPARQLDQLVARGMIDVRHQRHSNPPGLITARYWITPSGAVFLNDINQFKGEGSNGKTSRTTRS